MTTTPRPTPAMSGPGRQMPTGSPLSTRVPLLAIACLVLVAVACGSDDSASPATTAPAPTASPPDATEPSQPSTLGADATEYPITITNCGREITFEQAPERVFLANAAPVTYLASLGALDRVISKAGAFQDEYYDADTRTALAEIPTLTDRMDTSGHLLISKEAIIDVEPELMFGAPDGVEPADLADAGIESLDEPIYCEAITDPGFDLIYDQLASLGQIFDRNAEAEAAIAELQERAAAVEEAAAVIGAGRTAAFLYPTPGEVTTWAYGNQSMTHVQLVTLGFENVFADQDQRVFEVGLEDLLDLDPDVLILLHSTDDPDSIEAAITSLPGADRLTAVQDDAILVQLFNFSEPPSPLTLDGVEHIAEHFGQG